jgi:hypothetical protein
MSDEIRDIEDLDVEPLSDSDLESVAGGAADSCSCCTTQSGCTSGVSEDFQ